jgi:hypothetical protein
MVKGLRKISRLRDGVHGIGSPAALASYIPVYRERAGWMPGSAPVKSHPKDWTAARIREHADNSRSLAKVRGWVISQSDLSRALVELNSFPTDLDRIATPTPLAGRVAELTKGAA